ncbi:hypothetical protein [Streptomyces sp. A1-5]|uniref:hypothetical protein n=1 Tax=Streptomyces sp. A1-5 TaxID=2738410 RepID=UPI001F32240A|nr:hypothetical protein [Streptomyces sp. A1-5]
MQELAGLKRRLTALERKPDTITKFDRYPVIEGEAVPRGPISGNPWNTCGLANVTGMVFDRIECKFNTDWLIKGRREAEVRLAAFRHSGKGERKIVSVSGTLELNGLANRAVATVLMRWIHGIPYGWDYEDDTTVYTIELQHRYKRGPEHPKGQTIYAIAAQEGSATNGNILNWGYRQDDGGKWWWIPAYRNGSPWAPDFVTVPNRDPGTYSISAMHYCVGLPQERIPEASTNGWAWIQGSDGKWTRDPNLSEPFFSI